MPSDRYTSDPLWRLHCDVLSARALTWLATTSRRGDLRPEAHLYLSDRYGRLARRYRRLGVHAKAGRYDDLAAWHFHACDPSPPRPAAAVMPIPKPPMRVDAVAKPHRDPEDAA